MIRLDPDDKLATRCSLCAPFLSVSLTFSAESSDEELPSDDVVVLLDEEGVRGVVSSFFASSVLAVVSLGGCTAAMGSSPCASCTFRADALRGILVTPIGVARADLEKRLA